MKISKSSRHQKIIGNFGEMLICNWLSRSGFEVTVVDHTGIDVVAYHPPTKKRLGVTVKSRTRNLGKEKTSVKLFSRRKGKDDRKRVAEACKAFGCEPWIGVYVEAADSADLYLTSLEHYDQTYLTKVGKAIDDWKMGDKHKAQYKNDTDVRHIHIAFSAKDWWR